ncbi:MAG: thiamine pyrophosphate-dependent enzyme, partial [Acidobacteriota bacterium]
VTTTPDTDLDQHSTTTSASAVGDQPAPTGHDLSPELSREHVLDDYRIACESREASLLGRREALTGKAKFGIFGDGKELPQLALARVFRNGDWRSGYYRDQTWLLAAGMVTLEQLFAQLYADPDADHEPMSAGRQMNSHFATHVLDREGRFEDLTARKHSVADSSPTGSQMPRLTGLAQASKLYRQLPGLAEGFERFSTQGNEVAFGSIGNASCAEGMFWETVNAIGVLGVPAVLSIWDDDYGISVPNEHQITKGDLSALLSGFARDGDGPGYDLQTIRGWDYPALVAGYRRAVETARRDHVPQLIHVVELTQPQGHSTSGSHERYKSPERLAWEAEHDGLARFRSFILDRALADEAQLSAIEDAARERVRQAQRTAWDQFVDPIRERMAQLVGLLEHAQRSVGAEGPRAEALTAIVRDLQRKPAPMRRDLARAARDALLTLRETPSSARDALVSWHQELDAINKDRYGRHLASDSDRAARSIEPVAAVFDGDGDGDELRGFEILNRFFDHQLARHPELVAFGEDVGHLGDVNQGFAGLQAKHGVLRVADTGIRECTILGQAIGLALRGLRPLCEIQYLDYLAYALQLISDDLATLRWRSAGRQAAPVIIRTRGHRLEGVWHSGSPMAGILNMIRGVHLCVPRDMTRAAGMYATLLRSDESAIVVEVLNGYRLKERVPSNLGEYTVPLGVPEVLREGSDVTLVTYGACCRIALDAAEQLAELGIDIEVIDVQTLLPFDVEHRILDSVRKT